MRADGYLDDHRSGIGWLLDPDSVHLRSLGDEIASRTPSSPCGPDAVLQDLGLLVELLPARHVGLALGRADVGAALDVVDRWARRVRDARPATWDDAVGEDVLALQAVLRDRHTQVLHGTARPPRRPRLGTDDGPAWESRDLPADGGSVRYVRIRTLLDSGVAGASIGHGVAAADEDFSHGRMIVDLRGNGGGNDAHVHAWTAGRASRPWAASRGGARWVAGARELPVNAWNFLTLEQVTRPGAALPPSLLELRHDPAPSDRLRLVTEEPEATPAGERPWAAACSCWSTAAPGLPPSRRP